MPNFLSHLRKYRRFWAVFTSESARLDQVRSSLMNTPRNLKHETLSTSVHRCEWECDSPSLPLPEVHDHLLSLADVEREVVVLAPWCQVPDLLIIVGDENQDGGVIHKLKDGVARTQMLVYKCFYWRWQEGCKLSRCNTVMVIAGLSWVPWLLCTTGVQPPPPQPRVYQSDWGQVRL